VGLLDRSFRAAAAAVVLALACCGALAPATFAAEPAGVTVSGTLVDEHGGALAGVHLVIEEELPPDGGLTGFQAITDSSGAFSADLEPWGTADAPATVTVKTPADGIEVVEVIDGSCTRSWSVVVDATRDAALADGPIDPLVLTATTDLIGEVCGTTATPPPAGAGTRGPTITPPPTDALAPVAGNADDRLGVALTLGFAAALATAIAFLTPRPRGRRRS
jgi:hypothetical protein